MTTPPPAPMPAALRAQLNRHPAQQIPCPFCRAPARAACATATGRRLPNPHPARTDAWNARHTTEETHT
ncbi:hypothetical protein ABZ753_21585 [Streptomyces griseoincarnatus]